MNLLCFIGKFIENKKTLEVLQTPKV